MVEPAPLPKNWPPGFGFRPRDDELVKCYLRPKLKADDPSIYSIITEIDILKYEPWDLPAFSMIKSEDQEWFFLSPLDYKYRNSTRSNRTTARGFWKATGKDRKIKDPDTDCAIATKKTLVFYEGRVPNGRSTDWVIHEYHDLTLPNHQRTHVLCKLIKRPEKKSQRTTYEIVYDAGEPSSRMVSDDENPEVPVESDELANSTNSMIQTSINYSNNYSNIYSNSLENSNIYSNELENSTVETPLNYSNIYLNELENSLENSNIYSNELENSTTVETPLNYSNYYSNELENSLENSNIYSTELENSTVGTPFNYSNIYSNELENSLENSTVQTPLNYLNNYSNELENSKVQTPQESNESMNSTIQAPLNECVDLTIQTSHELNEFNDSPVESCEFLNYLIFLLQPGGGEQ